MLTLLFVISFFADAKKLDQSSLKYEKAKLEIAGKVVDVEIADTSEKREHGLMDRKNLKPDTGMLFIFDQPQFLAFWMKNTKIPLSIGFFNKDKKLINALEMVPEPNTPDERLKRYPSEQAAQYALEMSVGWFNKNKITAGKDSFKFYKP